MQNRWILPEYIEDILSPQARRMEELRRKLLDLFHATGYELIIPPMLEHLDSLLTGTGKDLQHRTFSVVDQLSGRLLGVRADISPQAARIDAHLLNRDGAARLCYAGQVLHTLPEGQTQKRELLQVGAELFGYGGIEADIEIQQLLLDGLKLAGVGGVHLDIGHVGIYRSLADAAGLDREAETELFEALRGKDVPTVRELAKSLAPEFRDAFLALADLNGGAAVLEEARRRLPALPAIGAALDDLDAIAAHLTGQDASVSFDLAELRGYHYHSGVVFAAWAPGLPHPLARGGRYDEVGKAFGRARPATGFSIDLKAVAALLAPAGPVARIAAPWGGDAALAERVAALRAGGAVVVRELPGMVEPCDSELRLVAGQWQVVPRPAGA